MAGNDNVDLPDLSHDAARRRPAALLNNDGAAGSRAQTFGRRTWKRCSTCR